MKYAVQGSIILKPHRARRRRQTQRTNPRVVFILDSKHSQWLQKSLAFSKRSIRALYINDCCVLVITMLFIPTHGQLLRYSSTSQDGTPVTAKLPRAPGHGKVGKGANFYFIQFQGLIPWLQFTLSSTLHFGHLYWNMRKSDSEYKSALK